MDTLLFPNHLQEAGTLMNQSLITQAITKLKNRYLLINLISKRIKQLNNGARPLVETPGESNLETVLLEVLDDKIWLSMGELEGAEADSKSSKDET